MKVAVFSVKPYDEKFLTAAAQQAGHELDLFEARLNAHTAPLANGFPVVCPFVNDRLDADVLRQLAAGGTRLIALRCAGFNNVDLAAAEQVGILVARVPAYSPHAVAEHTVGLMLALNRKLHRAHNRVRDGNFALDGLLGFDMQGKTVGIVGTGKIGAVVARILHGFGCRLLLHDVVENEACLALGGEYLACDKLIAESDIITLHCPLTPATHHLIDAAAIRSMTPGAMLINTSRGALVDTLAVIKGLKNGQLGYLALDVYEEEADLFFEDLSTRIIHDDIFTRLLTFPNVLITGHQGFFTSNALSAISATTMKNITAFAAGDPLENQVTASRHSQ